MKFRFDDVENCFQTIEKDLNELDQIFQVLKSNFDSATNSSNWNSRTCDYYKDQLRVLYKNMENVRLVSSNAIAFMNGVLENYRQLNM